jgi:hypothetical protein
MKRCSQLAGMPAGAGSNWGQLAGVGLTSQVDTPLLVHAI